MHASEGHTPAIPAPTALSYSNLPDFEADSRPLRAFVTATIFAGWSSLFAVISFVVLFTWMKMRGDNFMGGWFAFTVKVSLLGGTIAFITGFLSILGVCARMFFSRGVLRAGRTMAWTAAVYSVVTVALVNHSNSQFNGLWFLGFPLICGWFFLRRRSPGMSDG